MQSTCSWTSSHTRAVRLTHPHHTTLQILSPGLRPGAVDVFLDFISYSGGPLPEDLLAQCRVPVSMLWGEKVRGMCGRGGSLIGIGMGMLLPRWTCLSACFGTESVGHVCVFACE